MGSATTSPDPCKGGTTMNPKYKVTLLAAAMSLSFLFGDRAISFGGEILGRLGWTDAHRTLGEAAAQENPDDDEEDDDDLDDPGGDGGVDDPGNDGAGDDPGGDDGAGGDDGVGGDDGAGGDDGGAGGGDDDGPGGDDGGAGGGDDDGPGGDDGGAGGGDDDGPGGDDGGGTGGGDDGGPGGDDGGGTGGTGGGDDDNAPGGRGNNSNDDEPPGGAGVRGLDGAESIRIRDGDDDTRGLAALPEGVDVDSEGRWVKAGEILALEADPTSLEFARGLGFQIIERHRLTTLGMSIVELRVPSGQNTREALEAVRRGDPDTAFDFNHVYTSAQTGTSSARTQLAQRAAPRTNEPGVTVGIVDTAIDTTHPALRGVRIQQVNFAGRNAPVEHGTAVASVLAGDNANNRLLAASVVERQTREGGELASADALVRALDWLAQNRAPVANISLAGPPNALVEDAVRRAQARGMIIVAAVGNDGPAAPPLYPAAYDGVVGVTAVDNSGGIYRRAGRGAHVDVAAPGVGVFVAAPGGRMAEASGTSYAAPTIAAALAQQHTAPDASSAQTAVQRLLRSAQDAGARGTDPVYGAGVVRAGQTQ